MSRCTFIIANFTDAQAEKCVEFLMTLKKASLLSTIVCTDGFRSLAAVISQREASTPRIGTAVAQLLTNSMQQVCDETYFTSDGIETLTSNFDSQGLIVLSEVAAMTENGTHYPLFLLVLQQLNKTLGKQALTESYNSSKVINIRSIDR